MNFLMLGRLEIRDVNGAIIPVRRLKHRRLLATLLLEADSPVSNHQLMESLWGDDPPRSAERNIKTYVHTLRKLLCPDDLRSAPIETQADGYLIALDRDDLDLSIFRYHVRQAKRAAQNQDSDTAHHRSSLVRLLANEQAPQQGTPAARGTALDRALSSHVVTARLAVDLLDHPNGAPAEVGLSTDPAPPASEEEARMWPRRERANLLSAASQAMDAPEERTARLGAALTFSLFWRARQASHGPGQGHDPLRARNRSTRSVIVDRSRPVSSSTRRMR